MNQLRATFNSWVLGTKPWALWALSEHYPLSYGPSPEGEAPLVGRASEGNGPPPESFGVPKVPRKAGPALVGDISFQKPKPQVTTAFSELHSIKVPTSLEGRFTEGGRAVPTGALPSGRPVLCRADGNTGQARAAQNLVSHLGWECLNQKLS